MLLYGKQGDQYVLTDEDSGDVVAKIGETVMLAFSIDSEAPDLLILHKHGHPERVARWKEDSCAKLEQQGLSSLSGSFHTVKGRFDLKELNHLIQTSGYLKRFLDKHGIAVPKQAVAKADDVAIDSTVLEGELVESEPKTSSRYRFL